MSGAGTFNSAADAQIDVTFSKVVKRSSISGISSMSCITAGFVTISAITAGADSNTVSWTVPAGQSLAADQCIIDIRNVTDPNGAEVDSSTSTAALTSVTAP